jgi:hypothetical protein
MALAFRAFCLQHSVVDFSLLIDSYARHLMRLPTYEGYIAARYRHVLADNVEENPPVAHDLLRALLPGCDSALIVEDDPGGFRLFLGADPASARELASACDVVDAMPAPQQRAGALAFGERIALQFEGASANDRARIEAPVMVAEKYWSGMLTRVAARVIALVDSGAAPESIAVLAPFVEDVLRFELTEALASRGIALRVLRPSRPLFDHPAVRACVTLARLAHPHWQLPVTAPEVARALSLALHGLDVPRAQLLADAALKAKPGGLPVIEDQALWTRVGMRFFERYSTLAAWVSAGRNAGARIDLFWQQLFSEVLSLPGFGLHHDHDAAGACATLISSARTFHDALDAVPALAGTGDAALEYVELLRIGVMAATPPAAGAPASAGVLLAPVYTFLTHDLRAEHQIWLDVSTLAWYQRLRQPLTHPHLLSRRVPAGAVWTEQQEHQTQRAMTARVIRSLTLRCAGSLTLAQSQLSLTGNEDDGPLARAARNVLAAT